MIPPRISAFLVVPCAVLCAAALLIAFLPPMHDKTRKMTPPPSSEVPFPIPVVFDPATDALYSPGNDWSPVVETDVAEAVDPQKLNALLRVACIAKRGIEYAENRPILVHPNGESILVRFPADTNAPAGFRHRGPTWACSVVVDPETLRVLDVFEDPN